MIVEITRDIDLINAVMFNDEIFKVVSEDGSKKENLRFDIYTECWLSIKSDNKIIGLCNFKPVNSVTLECHIQILPEYRKENSAQAILKIYEWILKDCPVNFVKLIANIPVIYSNVSDFCLKNGFKKEGLNRLSYLKNGELHDVIMLGITKDEILEVLNG